MSGVLIVKPLALAAAPAVAGTGAANLVTDDPNEAWIAPSAAPIAMDIDLGAEIAVDSFYLGYTNAAPAASWSIAHGTGPGAGLVDLKPVGPMRAADSLGPRHHAFHRLAVPVVGRYFRLSLAQDGAEPLFAGRLVIGRAFEKHRDYGPGRLLIDTSTREDLPGGGFGFGDGVVKAQFAFSFSDLTTAQRDALYAIKWECGLRKPVVLVEDADAPAGLNEAIHYGVFDRFQVWERANPRDTKWAGAVIDWA